MLECVTRRETFGERGERMILGDPLIDVIAFLAFGWIGAFLLIPWSQWIEYKIDCKKRGKEQADEIRKRWR